MRRYDAVLFDWMLTLAHYPGRRQHVERAHKVIGRAIAVEQVHRVVERLRQAETLGDVAEAAAGEDRSAEAHLSATRLLYDRAGIDDELATAMYGLLGDPSLHPVYPEVPDVLAALAATGVRIAVVSDIHVDLRVHAQLAGIEHLVDAWVLSYEHGVQKPDAAIFQRALDALQVDPQRALMVGDRASHDGAASHLGVDTLILPARARITNAAADRLGAVVQLVCG